MGDEEELEEGFPTSVVLRKTVEEGVSDGRDVGALGGREESDDLLGGGDVRLCTCREGKIESSEAGLRII